MVEKSHNGIRIVTDVVPVEGGAFSGRFELGPTGDNDNPVIYELPSRYSSREEACEAALLAAKKEIETRYPR